MFIGTKGMQYPDLKNNGEMTPLAAPGRFKARRRSKEEPAHFAVLSVSISWDSIIKKPN
jgi:hypothetical protein